MNMPICQIIRRSDFRSYSCVNLLRDIMTDEMFDFLLEELKKDVLINEPLSIEIMKIITCNNFPEYYSFLDFAKDNMLTNGTTSSKPQTGLTGLRF